MELVAFVGNDRENWGQVSALVKRMECDKVIIVKNKEAGDFPVTEKCEVITINSEKPLVELKREMMDKLKEKVAGDFEVALSIASGNGKEHMALISALLSIPVGIKLVIYTKEGIEFVN